MIDLNRELLPFRFNAIVNADDTSYFVSCVDTLDHGIELMVFKLNEKHDEKLAKNYASRDPLFKIPDFNEADWDAKYEERYDSIEEASDGFDYTITNIKRLL